MKGGQLFITPSGIGLSEAVARELDDSFFESRPLEYFVARIRSLISAAEPISVDLTSGLGQAFSAALGIESTSALEVSESGRELQVATDAFALRHHAAEALVRLYHGMTVAEPGPLSAPSLWALISKGPNRTVDLVNESKGHLLEESNLEEFAGLVLSTGLLEQLDISEAVQLTLGCAGEWLQYAMLLLVRNDVQVNAAHNKVKHGLAVRSRNDERLSFIPVPAGGDGPFDENGNVRLSAISGDHVVDVFTCPTVDYLAQAPKENGRTQGLEISTLRLDVPMLLAEAWMMAHLHAAMFSLAGQRHFAENGTGEAAPYPSLSPTPTPREFLEDSFIGMRHAVTLPPDGGPLDRKPGFASQSGFTPMNVDYAGMKTSVIVDG